MNNLYNVYINRTKSVTVRGLRNARVLAKSVNLGEVSKVTSCSTNYPITVYSTEPMFRFLNPTLGKIMSCTDSETFVC